MSEIERTYEKQALAIHYVVRGGLPFVDRAAALHVVVAAQDEIVRLTEQLAEVASAGWALNDAIVTALRGTNDEPDPQALWQAVEAWQADAPERGQ